MRPPCVTSCTIAPDPVALQQRWHDVTLATVDPWYRTTLAFDEGRLAEIDAVLEGRTFEPTSQFEIGKKLSTAAGKDPEMLRAVPRTRRSVGVARRDPGSAGCARKGRRARQRLANRTAARTESG